MRRGADAKAGHVIILAKETKLACTISGRLVDHGLLGKQGIVGIYDVFQQKHFVDAEPSQFRVLVADVGGATALPTRNGINVMQRVSIEFRLPLLDGCDEPKSGWCDPDFFLSFADKGIIKALAGLNVPADRIPMVRPHLF